MFRRDVSGDQATLAQRRLSSELAASDTYGPTIRTPGEAAALAVLLDQPTHETPHRPAASRTRRSLSTTATFIPSDRHGHV